jgi:hypothetical protein
MLSDRFHTELQAQIKDFIDKSIPNAFLKLKDMMQNNVPEPEEEGGVWDPTVELKR